MEYRLRSLFSMNAFPLLLFSRDKHQHQLPTTLETVHPSSSRGCLCVQGGACPLVEMDRNIMNKDKPLLFFRILTSNYTHQGGTGFLSLFYICVISFRDDAFSESETSSYVYPPPPKKRILCAISVFRFCAPLCTTATLINTPHSR